MTKRTWVLLLIALLCVGIVAVPAWAQYQTKVYFTDGGDTLVIDAGGQLQIEDGATVEISDATFLETNGGMYVNAPLTIGTATPALNVNSAGGSRLFEVRDASTPVFTINDGGAWGSSGAGTHSGAQVINNAARVSAGSGVATATPAFAVNSAAAGNVLEVRAAETPVFAVAPSGAVTGKVLRYPAANGQTQVCGTDTITGTLAVTDGLTGALTHGWCSLAQDFTEAAASCTYEISGHTMTVKVWQFNATPTAGDAGALVTWCAIGN